MANYKKISELETVTEVTKSMNVLIEDNGVLKKVSSGGNIGGGGSSGGSGIKTIVLIQDLYSPGKVPASPVGTLTSESGETYADLMEYFNAGIPFMILVKEIYDSSAGYTIASRVYPDSNNGTNFITIHANQTFYWRNEDSTGVYRDVITIVKPGSGGDDEPN